MNQNHTKIIALVFAILIFCSIQTAQAQTPQRRMTRISPNTPAPELYADKINFRTTLVNLPGAAAEGSYYQVFYEMYFVSESEYKKTLDNLMKDIPEINGMKSLKDAPPKEAYSVKTLLASGSFAKKNLKTIDDRIEEKTAIPFSAKIAEKDKTQGGHILTFYTVKIFDAKLDKTVYRESAFVYKPFEQDEKGKNTVSDSFYLSFYVNEKGDLYTSSLKRDKSESWGRGDK